MNQRKRKKWLKKHNKYINPRDTWNLDIVFAQFMYPRIKMYKETKNCHPGTLTPEEWDEILDKMLKALEIIGWEVGLEDKYLPKKNPNWLEAIKERNAIVEEGMKLFAEYVQDLWW